MPNLKDLPKFYAKVPKGKWEKVKKELEDAGYRFTSLFGLGEDNCITTLESGYVIEVMQAEDAKRTRIIEISLDEALAILLPEKYIKPTIGDVAKEMKKCKFDITVKPETTDLLLKIGEELEDGDFVRICEDGSIVKCKEKDATGVYSQTGEIYWIRNNVYKQGKSKSTFHDKQCKTYEIRDGSKNTQPTWTTKKEITRSDGIKVTPNTMRIKYTSDLGESELYINISGAKELHDKLRAALAKHKKEFND